MPQQKQTMESSKWDNDLDTQRLSSHRNIIATFNRVCGIEDELNKDWEFLIPQQQATTHPDINVHGKAQNRSQME